MSIWKSFLHDKKTLNENKKVDVLIIGGGLSGLLTAYYLKDKNLNISILEARTIGSGVTKNTTAKITYLQERIYSRISSFLGQETSKVYLNSQLKAIKEYKKIIEKENIDCDFIKTPSYVFSNTKKEIKKLNKEINFLKKEGIKIEESPLPINTKYYSSFKVEDTYTFNPLKFLNGIYDIIKDKINIYENTTVYDVKKKNNKYICNCGTYSIETKKVVFASHYPYFLFPLMLPLKSYIEKSYIIITKENEYRNFSCISSNKPIISTRFYKDNNNIFKISLGSSHNTMLKQNDEENFKNVQREFNIKDENILMKYSNTDIITSDYIPYIGEIKENMYIACGYNTWGMTNSLLSGLILSDLIKSGVSEYKDLFNPKRFNLSNIINLPFYLINQIVSYSSSKLFKNKPWYKDVKTIKEIGDDISVYTDEFGIEHKVKNKCPHMGCGLIFNEVEKCWDCPCHSSRFDIDGNLIKGPSNKNIKVD